MRNEYLHLAENSYSPGWIIDGPWRPIEPTDSSQEIVAKINGMDCVPVRLCGIGESKRDRIETICDNENPIKLESGIPQFVNSSKP